MMRLLFLDIVPRQGFNIDRYSETKLKREFSEATILAVLCTIIGIPLNPITGDQREPS